MTTGIYCPNDPEKELDLLSTTNEWKYYCSKCDRRFNEKLEAKREELMPESTRNEGRYDGDVSTFNSEKFIR